MHLLLNLDQLWPVLIGALVPGVTYVLNHYAPWVTEPVKAIVLAVVAAAAGALYVAINTNVFGFNSQTLQLVVSAVIAAFAAHALFWKPSAIAAKLGAGSNAPAKPAAKP